jgi:rhodanese-related sulfurtransferase
MLKKSVLTLAAVGLLAAAVALPPAVQAQNFPDSVRKLVADAKKQVPLIKMDAFRAGLDKKTLGLIVDVRDPDEFAAGHIPGAINVSRGLIEFRIWTHVGFPDKTDMNKQMTLYCLRGSRCALAAKSLRELGFTNVTAADMNFDDWVKAGHPVTKPAK